MTVSRTTCVGLILLSVLVLGGGVGVASADDATDPSAERSTAFTADAGTVGASNVTTQSDTIQTDHFEITYESGQRGEAEELAEYADEYYELLFQRFGVAPADRRVTVRIVDGDPSECDGDGCYQSGLIVLSSAERGLFYHELTHHLQDQTFGVGGSSLTPEVSVEGTARHLEAPPEEIATRASFDRDDVYFHSESATGDEYDTLALFPEYVLHEYGREGYDVLFTEDHPRELESVTDEEYSAIIDDFYDQLDAQESRMRDGGASAPGFTYDPFLVERGEEVTFDARTPAAIEAIDRSWYNGEVDAYEWDFDGDGEIDATGPTVTRTIDDPVDKTVTLYVTIDGERHEVSQTLLPAVSPEYSIQSVSEGSGTFEYSGTDSWGEIAATAGQNFTLDVDVRNDGGVGGTEKVELLFRDEVVAATTASVDPGESRAVTLSHTLPSGIEPGNHRYQVRMGDEQTREKPVYVVEEASVELAPHGRMTTLPSFVRRLDEPVPADSRVAVSATAEITEPNGVRLQAPVELYLDGELVDEKYVELSSREDVDFAFRTPDEPGEYQLRAVVRDEQGTFDGSTDATQTLAVANGPREDEPVPGRCGPELRQSCSLTVESVDGPEDVTVGTESAFDIDLRQDRELDLDTVAVQGGIDGENARIETESSDDGRVRMTITETFDEPGEYNLTMYDRTIHSINVTQDADESDGESADAEGSVSGDDESADDEGNVSGDDESDGESSDGSGSEDRSSSEDNSDSSTPGFGVAAAAFSIALTLLALRRSR